MLTCSGCADRCPLPVHVPQQDARNNTDAHGHAQGGSLAHNTVEQGACYGRGGIARTRTTAPGAGLVFITVPTITSLSHHQGMLAPLSIR